MKVFSNAFAVIFQQATHFIQSSHLFICLLICLLICLFIAVTYAQAEEDERTRNLYHLLATQEFPELNEAIQKVIAQEPQVYVYDQAQLTKTTIDVYKNWYERSQKIRNTPMPESAAVLLKTITPDGFRWLAKQVRHPDGSVQQNLQEHHIIINHFLKVLGIAIQQNETLKPLENRLVETI